MSQQQFGLASSRKFKLTGVGPNIVLRLLGAFVRKKEKQIDVLLLSIRLNYAKV
jgi:hypothetical protein